MNQRFKHPCFTLISSEYIEEIHSTAHYLEHVKSGAKLLYLENDGRNKTFGIGFRTPPADSSGVAHIVEHSVLSGSRKFRSREPFMDMMKTSMWTFLNAMTFSDMTLYPISSQNDRDFMNLMDVYLDAVLYPRMLETKEIFLQEGWHYEIFNKDEELRYNGVVYNEMRGAYSSPETQINHQIVSALHPNSTYSHESGGYPYAIPELTYEGLQDFHRRYYHPSNALIFLNGKLDFDSVLQFLDEEYLSHFSRKEAGETVRIEKGGCLSKTQTKQFFYNADASQNREKNSYLSYSVRFGVESEARDQLLGKLLSEILIHSESSPLRRAIMESKLGEDILQLESDGYFLDFGLILKGANASSLPPFQKLIEESLADLLRRGIPRDLVLAALNGVELEYREADGSYRGITWFIRSMMSFRNHLDPRVGLRYEKALREIRDGLDERELENYIEERILGNEQKILAAHEPKSGLFEELDQEATRKLRDYKLSLSEEDLEKLIQENVNLREFQTRVDSKEDKDSLPKLSPEDLPKSISQIPHSSEQIDRSRLYLIPQNSSGVNYFYAAFNVDDLSEEDLSCASLLTRLLGLLDTERYAYVDLNNEILKVCGGLAVSIYVSPLFNRPDAVVKRLCVRTMALRDLSGRAMELTAEVLQSSRFDDKERLRELLQIIRSDLEMRFDHRGDFLAMSRVLASFSPVGVIQDRVSGLSFYDYIQDLLKNFDDRFPDLQANLSRLSKQIFVKEGLDLLLCADEEALEGFKTKALTFLDALPAGGRRDAAAKPQAKLPRQEAVSSSSSVLYDAKGGNLLRYGLRPDGRLLVLSSLLSKDYLHNAIRARGGAYGAGMVISLNGDCLFYSYRDPHLEPTLAVFDSVADYLRNLPLDQEEIEQGIVGSVGGFDPPISPSEAPAILLARMLSGQNEDVANQRLAEAKSCRKEDLQACADALAAVLSENRICVFGNKAKIESSAKIFSSIRPLNP